MATSGSFQTNHRVSGGYNTYATFNWWVNSQNVTENYTDIGWNLVGGTASSNQFIHVYGISVTINGVNMGASWSGNMYNGTVMASGTARIYHNADGSKNFSASAGLSMYSSSSWYSGSGSWNLNTIPRASQPSINTWPNNSPDFNVGDTITIHMNRASNSFTHKVYFNYGTTSKLIAENVTTNCTFDTSTISDALYALIPNAKTYSNTIKVITYNGSTNIGEKTCAYNAKAVEADVRPQFSDFSFQDTNSATTAITGNNQCIISGKSDLKVFVPATNKATPVMHATIANYLASIAGKSATIAYQSSAEASTTFDDIVAPAGAQTLSVSAVDSRGYSKVVSKNVNVIPYSAPTINANATRANNFENTTTLKVSGDYSQILVGDVAKNTISAVTFRYKRTSATSWSTPTSVGAITIKDGKFSVADRVLDLDNSTSWDIEITVTDKLGNVSASLIVSTGIPIFRIGVDGYVYNQEQPIMVSHVGQVIMSTTLDTADKVAKVYGGKWEAWGAGRVPVGVNASDSDFSTPGKTGGAKTVTLTVEQIPNHTHKSPIPLANYSGQYAETHTYGWAKHSGSYPDMNATGGGKAHSNLQPYIAIYMWHRVA